MRPRIRSLNRQHRSSAARPLRAAMPVEAAAAGGETASAPAAAPLPAGGAASFGGAMPKAEIGDLDFLKARQMVMVTQPASLG